jgi:hypothetical protein
MKNHSFVEKSWKLYLTMLFAITRYTSVKNLGALSWRDPCMWPFLSHLAWKPRSVIHDSNFLQDFFIRIIITHVWYFSWVVGHIKGLFAQDLHFFYVSLISLIFSKHRSKSAAWASISNGRIFQPFLWLVHRIVPGNLKMIFPKKFDQTISQM